MDAKTLIEKLRRLRSKAPEEHRAAIQEVVESLKLCPIALEMEDALDLIGVTPWLEERFRMWYTGKKRYIPKDGSNARLFLLLLYKNPGKGFSKKEVMQGVGIRETRREFRTSFTYMNSWSSMKTLVSNELVEMKGSPSKYWLTDAGKELGRELFGELDTGVCSLDSRISLLVHPAEFQYRVSMNVTETLNRLKVGYEKEEIMFGSFWFVREKREVLDVVVAVMEEIPGEMVLRRYAGSPFSRKVFVVMGRKRSSETFCIQCKLNYGINVLFIESSNGLDELVQTVFENPPEALGSIEEVRGLCAESAYCQTVRQIWEKQLRLFPGSGPKLAGRISAAFGTPAKLMQYLEGKSDPSAVLQAKIAEIYGRKPPPSTLLALQGLFAGKTLDQ